MAKLEFKFLANDTGLKKGIADAKKSLSGFERASVGAATGISNAIGGIGKVFAGLAIANVLMDSARAAVTDAKSQAILANVLRKSASATDAQISSVEDYIAKASVMAAVSDDQIRPAFARLAAVTKSTTEAQSYMNLALDLAATKNVSVDKAANAISKALSGQTTALTRMAPELKDSKDLWGDLAKATEGAAEIAGNNDPFMRMSIVMDELQEKIGTIFIPMINNISAFMATADFSKPIANFIVGIQVAVQQLDILANKISGGGGGVFQLLLDVASGAAVGVAEIAFWLSDVGTTIGYITSGQWDKAGNQMGTYFDRYNSFVDGIYAQQDAAAKAAADTSATTAQSLQTLFNPTAGAGGSIATVGGQTAAEKQAEKIKNAAKVIEAAWQDARERVAKAKATFTGAASIEEGVTDRGNGRFRARSASVMKKMRNLIEGAKTFAADIRKLKKGGADNALIQELVDMGPGAGAAAAKELLTSGNLKEFMKLRTQLSTIGSQVGEAANVAITGNTTAQWSQANRAVQGMVNSNNNTYNINLNNANLSGADIVASIRRYERQTGRKVITA